MTEAEPDLNPEVVARPEERNVRYRRQTWANGLIDRLLACGPEQALRITPDLFQKWHLRYGWRLRRHEPVFNAMAWGEVRNRLYAKLKEQGFKLCHSWGPQRQWLDIWTEKRREETCPEPNAPLTATA